MTVEVANNIAELDATLPDDTGTANEGKLLEDPAHTRLIKDVLKKVFNGVDGTGFNRHLLTTEAEINHVTGLASALQAQLTAASKTSVPIGGVIMYSGVFNNIPSNYALCTGGGGTPNLTSDFVYGTTTEGQLEITGGSNDVIIVAHTHAADHGHAVTTTTTESGHAHSVDSADSVTGAADNNLYFATDGSLQPRNNTEIEPDHTHPITIDTAFVTTTTDGVSGTDKNIPPYLQLAYIQRVS